MLYGMWCNEMGWDEVQTLSFNRNAHFLTINKNGIAFNWDWMNCKKKIYEYGRDKCELAICIHNIGMMQYLH